MDYKTLKEMVKYHSDLYYKQSSPEISDREFDILMKQLEEMEAEQGFSDPDSPTKTPGSDIDMVKEFKTLKHNRPMLSLENTYNAEEITAWLKRIKTMIPDAVFVIEPKYDGCSFAARYVNGELIQALSRGNGEVGEDLTQNLKLIPSLNKISKSFTGEIRGEIIMNHDVFERLNEENEGKYKNPRNLTSGTLKLLDPEEFKTRPLNSFVYWLEETPENKDWSHSICLNKLSHSGFNVGYFEVCSTIEDVLKVINAIEKLKGSFNYDIDGAVIKVDQRGMWKTLGETGKFPHYAKAYKYEPESAITTVQDITFEIGRTGKITPLCWFEPIMISGSEIQKATLNNKAYMENLDIKVGDKISVCKAAEIIPFIQAVHKDKRTGSEKSVAFPTVCPVCGTPLSKLSEVHADYFCKNRKCPGIVKDQIISYTKILEIDGFAEIVVDRLYNAGFLTSIQDLYTLSTHIDEITSLDRFGRGMVLKLIYNINTSKTQPFYRVLAALGIRGVGIKTAKIITKRYNSLDAIMNCSDFSNIEGIGSIVSNDIVEYFKDSENLELIEFLKTNGLSMANDKPIVTNNTSQINGKKICITGALSRPRKEFEAAIEAAGGTLVSSVSSKTDFLVTNDTNSGSSKNVKAKKLGIQVINEEDFSKLI